MADSFIEKPAYINKSSILSLIKSRLTINVRWRSLVVPLAIFLIALLPRILNLDAFMTADEDDQIMFANHFLKSAIKGDWAGALILGYPGVPTVIFGAIGVGFRYLAHYMGWLPLPWIQADFFTTIEQLTTQFGVFEHPFDFLLWARVPMVVAASLSILGIYLLSKRLLDEQIALVATLILAFDPFILAHSRVIHVDAPLSYFMFLSFLAFLLYLDQGAWKWLILSGLFGGLAGLSKTPAGLLGPILVFTGAIYGLFPPPGMPRSVRWKRLGVALVVWGVIALAAIFALWPSLWTRPVFTVQSLIRNMYNISGEHPTTGIFWGGVQTDQNPLYYLIVFPYHLTPLTTIGVVTGLGMIVVGLVARSRNIDNWLTRVLPLALGLIIYAIIFVAPVSAVARRGDRYILPVFFASGLLSALGLWWLGTLVKERLPSSIRQFKIRPIHIVGVALTLQILFVLFYHPYYLAYFNPIMGGYRTAPYRINVGWGEGLDLAAEYLNGLDRQDAPVVASWYRNQFAPYYDKGPTVDLSNQETALTADYTVFYLNQVQRGFPSQEILNYFRQREPAHVVIVGGIEYAWIYEGPIIGQEPQENFTFPVEAVLGGAARLYGVDVPIIEMPADVYASSDQEISNGPYLGYQEVGEGLPVTLYWETLGSIQDNHGKTNVYIHLVDDQGNIWGKVDRLILAGLWRPIRWNPGFFLRDEYKLPIDPATPPGIYHLEVGLYDFETGQNYGVAKNIGKITFTPPEKIVEATDLKISNLISVPVNGVLNLLGHDYVDLELPPGAEVRGKIFWQVRRAIDKEYLLKFSFLDRDGQEYTVAQQPLSPSYPLAKWQRSGIMGVAYRFRIPAFAPPGQYPIVITILDPDTGQSVGQAMTLANITIEVPERNFDLPDNVTTISAVLNNQIELVGYKLDSDIVEYRGSIGLTLYWRSLNLVDTNYTVFVHAAGPDQVIRGQWDSVPMQGTSPTSGWIPGEIIEDHYEVPMHKKAPAWKYDIFVGMYDPLTGERLPVFSPTAPVSENRVWLTQVQQLER